MSQRIRASILALVTAAVAVASLAGISYLKCAAMDSELRFLQPYRPPTIDEALICCSIDYAQRSDDANEVMFLGASSCRCGIDPKRVRDVHSYNLGSVNFGHDGILVLARACLRRPKGLKAIVLCLTPTMVDSQPNEYCRPIHDHFLLSYDEARGATALAEKAAYYVKRGTAALLPRAGDPRDLPLQGSSGTYRTFKKALADYRGYSPLPGVRGTESLSPDGGPPLEVHDDWDLFVRQLAADCQAAGVQLIIRMTPISTALSRNRDLSVLEGWTRKLESSAPVVVARPNLLVYDESLMWDAIHLNEAGVERFMRTVDADVHNALSPPAKTATARK
jgi:hypothetical protein